MARNFTISYETKLQVERELRQGNRWKAQFLITADIVGQSKIGRKDMRLIQLISEETLKRNFPWYFLQTNLFQVDDSGRLKPASSSEAASGGTE